jgi:hypothetical protein
MDPIVTVVRKAVWWRIYAPIYWRTVAAVINSSQRRKKILPIYRVCLGAYLDTVSDY